MVTIDKDGKVVPPEFGPHCAYFLPFGDSLAPMPEYQTKQAAGVDLSAWWEVGVAGEYRTILPGQFQVIPTGLCSRIHPGFEGQIRSRSGLAAKHGVFVLNSPGTLDSDFEGEIKVILANIGPLTFEVRPGDRIAQMVFAPLAIAKCNIKGVPRGEGGLGSTGK
jgi:dUTP pyrophosphatase